MSDELFDGSSNGGSVRDVRRMDLLEDQDVASMGIGGASPPKGAFLSSESNGRMLHL